LRKKCLSGEVSQEGKKFFFHKKPAKKQKSAVFCSALQVFGAFGLAHLIEQVIEILRKADGEKTVEKVCRESNIIEQTFY